MQSLHLMRGRLEPARRPDHDDPVHLVQGQEQLEHARQGGPPIQADQRLAPAAETRAAAGGGDDRAHRWHQEDSSRGVARTSSRGLTRPGGRRESVLAGSPTIIRPADVWMTDVTTAVIVWLSSRRPFWITTIVPSSRLPTPWPGSFPSLATVTTISSPGIATGRIACPSSLRFKTPTPWRPPARVVGDALV